MIKVSVLNENTAGGRGYLAEHGLSLLLQNAKTRILFDTGQSDVFMRNAEKMGEDLLSLNCIVLSHGHFDHCGGIRYLADYYREHGKAFPPVYVRENAFLNKTAVNSDRITYRNIGIPWKRQIIDSAVHFAKDREMVADGVWVIGNIPYTVEFEKKPDTFFIDAGEKRIPDYMEDEQILVFDTERGLSVFAGCCHPGIMNCLTYVADCFPGRQIYSVFAGMHLMNQGRERILQTVEALEHREIKLLMPVHCTGLEAIGRMKEVFGDKCLLMETGKVFEL